MLTDIALATCADLPDGDEDAQSLLAHLRAAGVSASSQVWTDPNVDWSSFALVVVRSTWDYPLNRSLFLAWTQQVAQVTALANPAPMIAWNSDKIYLRELAERGVPIVATEFFAPGEQIRFPAGEFVVKPSVGAGSKGAGRFHAGAQATATEHAAMLHEAGLTVMVQPYLADVDTLGETALIYLDGRFSHAIRKGPMLGESVVNQLGLSYEDDLFMMEQISARSASAAELAVGEQVLAAAATVHGRDPLYARVDLLPGADGPVLIELELCEPSLFLGFDDGAAARFAAAIAARAS